MSRTIKVTGAAAQAAASQGKYAFLVSSTFRGGNSGVLSNTFFTASLSLILNLLSLYNLCPARFLVKNDGEGSLLGFTTLAGPAKAFCLVTQSSLSGGCVIVDQLRMRGRTRTPCNPHLAGPPPKCSETLCLLFRRERIKKPISKTEDGRNLLPFVLFGSPAASLRPVALRPWVTPSLPLSESIVSVFLSNAFS